MFHTVGQQSPITLNIKTDLRMCFTRTEVINLALSCQNSTVHTNTNMNAAGSDSRAAITPARMSECKIVFRYWQALAAVEGPRDGVQTLTQIRSEVVRCWRMWDAACDWTPSLVS